MQPASKGITAVVAATLCLVASTSACAGNAAAPRAYSLTEHNALSFPETVQIYRDRQRVAMDTSVPRSGAMPRALHTRDVINLVTHKEWTWDADNPAAPCSVSTLSGAKGDWSGNPFEWLAQIVGDVTKFHPRVVGTATVAGLPTRITEFVDPAAPAPARIWVDTQYGLLMKMVLAKPGSPEQTMLEVTRFAVGKPPAREFAMPASCKRR